MHFYPSLIKISQICRLNIDTGASNILQCFELKYLSLVLNVWESRAANGEKLTQTQQALINWSNKLSETQNTQTLWFVKRREKKQVGAFCCQRFCLHGGSAVHVHAFYLREGTILTHSCEIKELHHPASNLGRLSLQLQVGEAGLR